MIGKDIGTGNLIEQWYEIGRLDSCSSVESPLRFRSDGVNARHGPALRLAPDQ